MTILCYHAVDPDWASSLAVHPERFVAHCAWLAARRSVIPLAQAAAAFDHSGRLPRGSVSLTFDDGFASVYDHAWPVLARHGLPATVFLVAGTLAPGGQPVDWVRTPPPQPLRTLRLEQVLEMQERGVSFGSHSYAHHDLPDLDEAECERDLRQSRTLLEDLLGRPVRQLAYPRGLHGHRVRRSAARAGYTHAFSLPEDSEPEGPMAIPRVGVYHHNGLAALRVKVAPWYLPLRTRSPLHTVHRLAKSPQRVRASQSS